MPAKIEYNGATVATIESGKVATIPVKDKKMASNIKVEVEDNVIPEYTEVADFRVFTDEADEGVVELSYDSSKDVKLSAGQRVRFVSLEDDNFVPWNIKNGVTIFGMTGSCPTETWVLTLADGSTVTKEVAVYD